MTIEEERKRIHDRMHFLSTHNRIPLAVAQIPDRNLRVAIYARVAAPSYDQVSSYELLISNFMRQIEEHPNWEFVGIYKDEGIIRENQNSEKEFNRMLEDCKAGKIDLVLTSSVTRFSKNAAEGISVVKMLGEFDPRVGVLFESDNIYTLDSYGKYVLGFYSAMAEKESRIKSQRNGIVTIQDLRNRFSFYYEMSQEERDLLGYKKWATQNKKKRKSKAALKPTISE